MIGYTGLNIFQVSFLSSKAGLSTVGYKLNNADGSLYAARTTSNVVDQGDGVYTVQLTFTNPWQGVIKWDTGDSSIQKASEEVIIKSEVGNFTSGTGSVPVTFTIKVDNIPQDGVSVYVTTDLIGQNVVAGTKYTDALGKVSFMLDPGNYYSWKQKSGVNFESPEAFTVV